MSSAGPFKNVPVANSVDLDQTAPRIANSVDQDHSAARITNSVDPGQTAPRSSLTWVHTFCLYGEISLWRLSPYQSDFLPTV